MKKVDKAFWGGYIIFCIFFVVFLRLFHLVDFTKNGQVENGILTASIIVSGLVMRLWFAKNPEEVKRRFKIDD